MPPQIAHLKFPVEIRDGQFVTVEQDSDADVLGCVELIARTPQGHWDSLPSMGLPDLAFSRPDAGSLRAMIEPYEPRARVYADTRIADQVGDVLLEVQTGGS